MFPQGVRFESATLQPAKPGLDESQHACQIQSQMAHGVFLQVRLRQFEQRRGWTQPFLLQVNKCPGQLNESFEEIAVRSVPVRQPQFFEHIMRLVKELLVEAGEIAQIVRVQILPLKGRDALRDSSALLAHAVRLIAPGPEAQIGPTNGLDGPRARVVSFTCLVEPGEGTPRMSYQKKVLAGLMLFPLSVGLCLAKPATVSSSNTNGDYVVLLHGLIRSSTAMKRLEWAFEDAGYRVINVNYSSTKHCIEDIAAELLAEVLRERIQDPKAKVHFVTHSLGGIVLREYLANNQLPNLGRVVMIAPPNQGSELVDKFRNFPFFKFFTGPPASSWEPAPNPCPTNSRPPTSSWASSRVTGRSTPSIPGFCPVRTMAK